MMIWYLFRVIRMFRIFLQRRISWSSFKLSLYPRQRTVSLIAGGVLFCAIRDERNFFQ
ncbi:hypothetical protein DZA65_00988 [Dickeya dianthicola]|nr:hypothetical protein DZA65_00988 [Dickeya dianthicola]